MQRITTSDRILVIGDVHLPAEHRDYLAFLCAVRDAHKTTTALQVGDMLDFHANSYHETDPDLPSAGAELNLMRRKLQRWADEFPTLSITMGNHDKIPHRKALSHGMPRDFLRAYNDLFGLPDTWLWAPGPICFKLRCGMSCVMQHAVSCSLAAGQNKLRTASLIQGHHHFTAGVAWNSAVDWRMFFLSAGCGVDAEHPAMAYADSGVLKLPALGCGVILNGYAAHIPMWLDGRGRWNRKVAGV